MKTISFFVFSLLGILSFSQNKVKAFTELYHHTQNQYFTSFEDDPDVFIQKLTHRMTTFFLQNEISSEEMKQIDKELNVDRKYGYSYSLAIDYQDENYQIRVYNFSAPRNGTSAYSAGAVIQWKNKEGKLFAYNLSPVIDTHFDKIHCISHAERHFYLLQGGRKWSGSCYMELVYGIELKGDYLILDHPFFVNRPYLQFCNLKDIQFDKNSQTLLIKQGDWDNLSYRVQEQGKYSTSERSNERLLTLLEDYMTSGVRLRFNGNHFEKAPRYEILKADLLGLKKNDLAMDNAIVLDKIQLKMVDFLKNNSLNDHQVRDLGLKVVSSEDKKLKIYGFDYQAGEKDGHFNTFWVYWWQNKHGKRFTELGMDAPNASYKGFYQLPIKGKNVYLEICNQGELSFVSCVEIQANGDITERDDLLRISMSDLHYHFDETTQTLTGFTAEYPNHFLLQKRFNGSVFEDVK